MSKPKRKKPANLTAMTLKMLRAEGWVGDVVERKNRFIARDFLGFADIVVANGDKGGMPLETVGVQVTSASNFADRKRKILKIPAALDWLLTGAQIRVMGWQKKKGRWVVQRDEYLSPDDFDLEVFDQLREGEEE